MPDHKFRIAWSCLVSSSSMVTLGEILIFTFDVEARWRCDFHSVGLLGKQEFNIYCRWRFETTLVTLWITRSQIYAFNFGWRSSKRRQRRNITINSEIADYVKEIHQIGFSEAKKSKKIRATFFSLIKDCSWTRRLIFHRLLVSLGLQYGVVLCFNKARTSTYTVSLQRMKNQ